MSKNKLSLVAILATAAFFTAAGCAADDGDDGAGGSGGSGNASGGGLSGLLGKLGGKAGTGNGTGNGNGNGTGGGAGTPTGGGQPPAGGNNVSCVEACGAAVTCVNQACGTAINTAQAECDSECAGATGTIALGENACTTLAELLEIPGGFQSICEQVTGGGGGGGFEGEGGFEGGGGGGSDNACCAAFQCYSECGQNQDCLVSCLQSACGAEGQNCAACEEDQSWLGECNGGNVSGGPT